MLDDNGAVYLGDGTGQFKAVWGGFPVEGLCAFGKLDGQPHIGAVCGQAIAPNGDILGGTQLLIFSGNGDGTFSETPAKTITYGDRTNQYNGSGTFDAPITVADMSANGIPDILADAGDGLTVLRGTGGLGFAYPAHYATGYSPYSLGLTSQFDLRIVDLNGDGLPDLIESGPAGVYITYGRPDGIFDTAPAIELTQFIDYETVADFNGDGIPDIAATGDEAIELSLGKGDGVFAYRTALPSGDGGSSTPKFATNAQIVHGDFNGDHHQDIVAFGSTSVNENEPYILFGHGDGTFTIPAPAFNSSQTFPISSRPLVFDFDGDGKDDLLAMDSNKVIVALSNGDGSFNIVPTVLSNGGLTPPAVADLNADGKLDLVLAGPASVEIFTGKGGGSFNTSAVKLAIPRYDSDASPTAVAVAVGDFDGDGHKDIALLATSGQASDGFGSVIFIYYGKGAGLFSAGVAVASSSLGYADINAADLNKDGLSDLVLRDIGEYGFGGAVGVFDSLGGQKFGPEAIYYAGSGLADLTIADLNGDGFPDLIVGNGGTHNGANSATILMNLGNGVGSMGVSGSLVCVPEPSVEASPLQLVASLDAPGQTALTGNVSFFIDGQPIGSAALVDNQASITVAKTYAAGVHSLRAMWPGDSKFMGVTLAGKHQVDAGYPTSTSVSNFYNPAPFLTSLTLMAMVQSSSGTPAGSVAFYNGSSHLTTVPLFGGIATFSLASLPAGTDTISAQYLPAAGWAASSGSLQQTIKPIDAAASVTVSPKTVYAFEPFALTATVGAPNTVPKGPTPTGTVQFSLDLSVAGTSTLVNGVASLTTSIATPGYHSPTAMYSGNRDYNPGYAPGNSINVLINTSSTHLQATPNPSVAAQAVTLTAKVGSSTAPKIDPTGSIQFIDNGGQIGNAQLANGVAAITLSTLAVGTHSITASYSGDDAFSQSTSSTVSVVGKAASSTTLSVTPNSAAAGKSVTLTAAVTGPRQPTGSIVFRDGTSNLAAAIPVDANGNATLSTSTLAAGKHSLVAVYSGDPNLNTSSSTAISVTITP